MDQDETWHASRSRPWPHCVRWGPSSPPQKGGGAPNFRSMSIGQTAGWNKMALGMEVGLGPGHILLLDEDPARLPKKGQSPQFSAHFYCGQTAGWIKMPLGMEAGLGPGDFVLDGDPAPPRKKGTAPTQFLAHVYCGHGRTSQLLLSSCRFSHRYALDRCYLTAHYAATSAFSIRQCCCCKPTAHCN